MAKLTFIQKAEASESASFQKRFQIALQERAIYWLNPANTTFNGKVAGVKYRTLADGIFHNRVATAKQRTPQQATIMFLAQYADPNPVLEGDGTPSDSVLSGQSADGQYYFDAYFRDWAEVTTSDETTDI
jgi:hypothetical protein